MALTSGITLLCTDGFAAGIKALYLIDIDDVVSFTLTSGSTTDYDTCTLATNKKWWKFEFEEDLAEYRMAIEGERGSYKVTHQIEFFVKGLSGVKMAALQQLIDNSPCGFYALVTDNNDIDWLVGYNETFTAGERPVRLAPSNVTTLKALGEVAGATMLLQCINTSLPLTYSGTITIT